MQLVEWAKLFGRGAYTALADKEADKDAVSYKTVLAKARDGEPSVCEVAEKLSRATKRLRKHVGGAWCSVDEIRFPKKDP